MLFEDKVDINETKLLQEYPEVLDFLLRDMTTGHNVLWCTDDYAALGDGYKPKDEIRAEAITVVNEGILKSRTMKDRETQIKRIRTKGEVFTPSWLCNKMNNAVDEEWFGQKDVFNVEGEKAWKAQNYRNIIYPDKSAKGEKSWQSYVKAKRLEITCGEAPYLASRYDMVTGEMIPLKQRIGLLDRKIHVLNGRRGLKPHQWLSHLTVALQSVYGYDWQGDNVILARENLLMDVIMFYQQKFKQAPSHTQIREWAEIIAWNIWQMDGLKYVIPNSCKPVPVTAEDDLFGDAEGKKVSYEPCPGCKRNKFNEHTGVYCKIKNWDNGEVFKFKDLVTRKAEGFMAEQKDFKFDVIIGNPPYQDNTIGANDTYQPPVYHLFLDAAYSVCDRVEMVHPARFLFNAGSTPKEWNQKMLNDDYLKIILYCADSKYVFSGTEIKGGIVVTYRDDQKYFGRIETFTTYQILNDILVKVVRENKDFVSFSEQVGKRNQYRFSEKFLEDHPEVKDIQSKGHADDLTSNVFENLAGYLYKNRPNCENKYVRILGRSDNERVYRFVQRKYIKADSDIDKYKVFMPQSSGSGGLGEVMSSSVIGLPGDISTETFLTVGVCDNKNESDFVLKYIKTKFARTLLSVLKSTQANTSQKWRLVPLQDFTSNSDIDWSKSVAEIDQQLYKKYKLMKEEIAFIESHVKEMA